nr:FKBP-type peptidyl-prolyl cis-trans isomerase [Pedobacter sp. ASV2]
MKKYTIALFSLLTAAVLFTACKKDYESIESVDEAAIQAYIKKNNLNMTKDPAGTGVYYQVVTPGTGDVFANQDSVLFTYQEKSITDGTTYYATGANTNSGTYYGYMSNTFNGAWGKALKGQQYGAKVRLLIPSHLAYGKNGNTSMNVPSNAVLDTYVNTFIYKKQWQLDDFRIQTYLTSKNLTATKDATRIYYIVNTPGTGASFDPESTTSVTIKYTGRFLDGTVFDSSTDGTFSTSLSSSASIIKAWKLLIPKFPIGTKFRMFIPSDIAYGTQGSVNSSTGVTVIPPNAVLDFDIEIVSVTN